MQEYIERMRAECNDSDADDDTVDWHTRAHDELDNMPNDDNPQVYEDEYLHEHYTQPLEEIIGLELWDDDSLQELYNCYCAHKTFDRKFAEHFFCLVERLALSYAEEDS